MLHRSISSKAPARRGARGDYIEKSDFVCAFWPLVAKKGFDYLVQVSAKGLSPYKRSVSGPRRIKTGVYFHCIRFVVVRRVETMSRFSACRTQWSTRESQPSTLRDLQTRLRKWVLARPSTSGISDATEGIGTYIWYMVCRLPEGPKLVYIPHRLSFCLSALIIKLLKCSSL